MTMMRRSNEREHITYVELTEAVKPRDGEAICNRWWVVDQGRIMLWRGFAPQCNGNRKIAEKIRDDLYPGCSVQLVPVVFIGRPS